VRFRTTELSVIPLRDINPTERFAIVTFILIILNIAVFIHELTLGQAAEEQFIRTFALVPKHLFSHGTVHGSVISPTAAVFTSMFLHGGILHISGNMLYLWIFGNNVEDSMGRVRFVFFYLLCGGVAAFSHAFMNSSSLTPMIGASGAISGVLGAYLLLYPRARVVTLIFFFFYVRTIPIPAMVLLLFWFLLQFLNAVTAVGSGGIAWYAHVAGFIAGMLLVGLFKRRDIPFGGGGRFRYS
jgi:membrane associated rhomboid family serine protease